MTTLQTPTYEIERTKNYRVLIERALEQSGCDVNRENVQAYLLNQDFRRLVNAQVFDPAVNHAFGKYGAVTQLSPTQYFHHVDPILESLDDYPNQ